MAITGAATGTLSNVVELDGAWVFDFAKPGTNIFTRSPPYEDQRYAHRAHRDKPAHGTAYLRLERDARYEHFGVYAGFDTVSVFPAVFHRGYDLRLRQKLTPF
jgi:hypothetical protein